MKYEITGLKLTSKLNERIHWAERARKNKIERRTAFYTVGKYPLPCIVRITRIGPRMLDDDNMAGSAKSVRDGIADRLGIADNHPDIRFEYAQRKGKYGVEIEFRPMNLGSN